MSDGPTRASLSIFGGDAPRRGRPRGPEERLGVSARFGSAEHDRIIEAARDRGLTVAEFVRSAVRRALPRRPRG
jgi:hypothetical protein